jgi:hypothetical protein
MAVPKSLNEALLAFQKSAPALQKDKLNPAFKGSKYVSLDGLMPTILPLLNEQGIVLSQLPSHIDGAPALTTRLTHVASGEAVETTMPLILDKDTAQGQGSAITYARRYAIVSILGLVADVDDDGNKASERSVEVVNRRARPAARKVTPSATDDAPDDTDGY